VTSLAADPAEVWEARLSGVPQLWARYTNLLIDRGEGSWLIDAGGERYLDYTSGIAVTNTGHAHPRIAAAVAEQATKAFHLQQNIVYHKPGLELHERLPRYFPGDVGEPIGLFLSNSGAEAIEASVKLAKIATRRPLVIAFRGGFHGRTHAAMSLTTSSVKYRGHYEPLQGGIHHVPFPDPLRYGGGEAALAQTMSAIEELFATTCYPDDVAAFILEPILGEGGYVIPPDTFLPALRELADRHGILIITDEIQTGYGRTGKFFASEWTGTVPDIVVMAKGIASGLPLSGIMARRSLIDKWPPSSHGGTYGGNVVSCAAALATLDVIEDEGLVANAEREGGRLLDSLRRMTAGNPEVAEVRGRGLMVAIDFADPGTKSPRPDLAKALLHEAFDRKLLLLTCGTYGNVVRIIPPLITTDEEVDHALGVIKESLAALS
jgi:4-aminobutyrate aminotransferase